LLLKAVGKYGGVYSTHLRNEREKIGDAVREAIETAKETGVKTMISHFRPLIGYEKDYSESLLEIERVTDSLNLHFNNYPFNSSIIAAYNLLPNFVRQGNLEVMLENISKPNLRVKILEVLKNLNGESIIIADAKQLESANGKTLSEFAKNREQSVPEALLTLMMITRLRVVFFVIDVNYEKAVEGLLSEAALISSNSAGLGKKSKMIKHERFTRTFPRFLEIVHERKAMSIEAAVKKVTSLPAEKFGLKKRGRVIEGYEADLVLFERAQNNAVMIRHVFVNGIQAVEEGRCLGRRDGRVLRRI